LNEIELGVLIGRANVNNYICKALFL